MYDSKVPTMEAEPNYWRVNFLLHPTFWFTEEFDVTEFKTSRGIIGGAKVIKRLTAKGGKLCTRSAY